MITVNIAKLKNELSSYLKKVRSGEDVLILDRHQPIARISAVQSLHATSSDEVLCSDLEAKGIIQCSVKELPSTQALQKLAVKIPQEISLVETLIKEREESTW
jgi:antitoxin (DNA-binding transcriptional repressor) of toxin-antitoxin stability system